ncbi:hypothetical protein Ancab_032137 [Ancistrocladus abbreviatus]
MALPIGWNLVLLSAVGQGELKTILSVHWPKLERWFAKSRFDKARLAIQTPIREVIHTVIWVEIDQENVSRKGTEEHLLGRQNVVSDSFGTSPAGEQPLGAVSTSTVVVEASKLKSGGKIRPADRMETATGRKLDHFQNESCCSAGAVDLDTPLGGVRSPACNQPISLTRPNGGPSSLGHAQGSTKKGGSVGPRFRPKCCPLGPSAEPLPVRVAVARMSVLGLPPVEVFQSLVRAFFGPEEGQEKAEAELIANFQIIENYLHGKRYFVGDRFGFADLVANFVALWVIAAQEAAGKKVFPAD